MAEKGPEIQESQNKLPEKQNTEGENEALANSHMQNALDSMIKNKDPKIQEGLQKSDLRKNVSKFLGEFFEGLHLEKKEDISKIESILRQQIEEMVDGEVHKIYVEINKPKEESFIDKLKSAGQGISDAVKKDINVGKATIQGIGDGLNATLE